MRIKNQKECSENFKDIGTAVNLLYYSLSSTTTDQLNKEVVDSLIKLLKSIFKERVNENDLQKVIFEQAKLTREYDYTNKKIKYYIQKHNSQIYLDSIEEGTKRNVKEMEKKKHNLEKYEKLPNFLECVFRMKLSNYDEPLLLSGNTCYKTYAAKIILKKADIVSLNQESTIPQLLGASFFYPPIEDKKFCLRLIYEILEIPNIEIELKKVDEWEKNKIDIIKTIEDYMPNPDSPFYIALKTLKAKLSSEEKMNEKSLINMALEFKPGLILSAILNKKSLILKDMPQVKTIVLERFNELFSGKHNLTLVEDIPGTLTTKENKELRNFNRDFRIIATCKPGDELKLSEALLSRFTLIACQSYSEEEEKVVLADSTGEDKDINEFNDLTENFILTERLNCLRITKKLDEFNKKEHENNLRISVYILQKGLIEQRESQISFLKEKFELNLDDYEDGICPFEKPEENDFLQSKRFKIKMSSFQKEIELYDKEIVFTKKFSELCDIILFGLSIRMPVILEGEAGQGKNTAIHYMAEKLGLDIINVVISKSTKVEDLLLKIIVEKSKSGEIIVKSKETELYKAIECRKTNPKKLILFQGINNASPAVLDIINSIFVPDAKILLPNGSILEKGNMNIIGVFNKGRDNINRDKIPSGILSNCIYYNVENPSPNDILSIITNLFIRMDFGEKENIIYTKNYLIDNKIKDKSKIENNAKILNEKDKNNPEYEKIKKEFEEYFQKAKELEAEDFAKKFKEAKLFSNETTNESPFTLNDIKKYIDFRESVPQINSLLIQLFIFVYHFSQEEYINKISEKLNLVKNIEFLPIIDYDEDKKNLVIKLDKDAKESIRVKVNNPEIIKIKRNKKLFDTLTKSQKHCFIFLICCIISKKTPIIQGPTASGKSYLLSVISTLLGQETNLYQMNSNTGMSILTGQEVIKGEFDEKEKEKICEAYNDIKDLIKTKKDKSFNDMDLKDYKNIISKIDKKLIKKLDEIEKKKLNDAKEEISKIIAPQNEDEENKKEELDENEKDLLNKEYNNISHLIEYEIEDFNNERNFNIKDYKKILSKIKKKLKEDKELDEDAIKRLKNARRTIFIIISPPSRFTHIDSVFIDSIIKDEGKWVILDGIEMAPSQVPEKIAPLCGENPELSIFESGKGIYINSNNIKENFQLFIIYNPFNKGSKILEPILFNKCVSFTLPSMDNSQSDSATIIYNSIELSKHADRNAWNKLSTKLAASHMIASKISENHLEQMAGGIKITPRNLAFITTDQNKNKKSFDDTNIDDTMYWIKSALTFYYFNSFIDIPDDKKKEKIDVYSKSRFKSEICNAFKTCSDSILTTNDVSVEDLFPKIMTCLLQIQNSSLNKVSAYNFNFGDFVKECLDVAIEEDNLRYIKDQIEDTLTLLNYSELSKESLYSFYQIKIVYNFYEEILENIGSVKVENKGQKMNSDQLLRIDTLKPILLKFRLLEGLTNKGKENFGYNINPVLHRPELNQFLLKLNELILNKNKSALKDFVKFAQEYHYFLNNLDTLFPFNQFNEKCKDTDFEVAYYYLKLMVELYKNKTNFIFIFDNEEFPFIFEEKQYDRILPILKLNEKNTIYLSIGTMCKYYKSKTGDMSDVYLIQKIENVNREKTLYFINLFKKHSGQINPETIKDSFRTFKNDSTESVREKKFLSSNLFLTNNSIIPKIWALLFSFNNESNTLKYIVENLLPFEREIFYIIKDSFYDKINDLSQIEEFIEFTNSTNFFYNEESFLWKDLIGFKLGKETKEEDYKNLIKKIDDELNNVETLKQFSWPDENIDAYKEILNKYLDDFNEKIETEKKSAELKKAEKNLNKLKKEVLELDLKGGLEVFKGDIIEKINKLLNDKLEVILKEEVLELDLKGGLEVFKGDIIEKINKLLNDKLEVILKETTLIEKEIKDLKAISKEKIVSLKKNDIDWGKPKLKARSNEESKTIKLYKNMLYYATCSELEQKILNANDNKERMRYGTQLERLGLRSLLKYINSLGNEALGTENRKTIKSMFRAQLMLKLWNDGIDQVSIKNFISDLNSKSQRNLITDEEYGFTYQIASEYSLTTKIIQPNFQPKDIIYLFFKYNENNEYVAGPIFDDINMQIKMNILYQEVIDEVKNKNLDNICDICVLASKIMHREFTKKYDEVLPDNYDELLKKFKEENYTKNKKILDKLINALKLSKYIDEIIKIKKETPLQQINFDDMAIFNKKDVKRIDIEGLLTKKINPSFKYYIIKNLQLLKSLINSKLTHDDISDLFQPQKDEAYIPFWVFLIRNMSAINCINYEEKTNPFCEDISSEIRQKIEIKINEGKEKELDDSWLNLTLDNIPNEIEKVNIRLFYSFFNNLFEKLNESGYLKEKIQNLIKDHYFELLNESFKGTIDNILSDDIKTSNNNILKLIDSPKKYIKNIIENEYSDKSKKIFQKDKFKDLEENLEQFINKIPNYIEQIKGNVVKIEELYKGEKEKEEVNKVIKDLETKLDNYNLKYEKVKKQDKNKVPFEFNIHPNSINEFNIAKENIEKYNKLYEKDGNETIIYWKIPFKKDSSYKNLHIRYEKKTQILKGQFLYFIIDEISDEFKEKLSITKTFDNNEEKEVKIEDYIKFEEAEKIEITKLKIEKNEELNEKISQDFIKIKTEDYPKVVFKGKTVKEISNLIDKLKNLLSKIKEKIELMKKGDFENLELDEIKDNLKDINIDINYYFDVKENKNVDQYEEFKEITVIKAEFEKYILSINKDFKILSNEFNKNLGEIPLNLSYRLNKTFIDNFDMPSLPEIQHHYVDYDNLKVDSPLLSMPTISKKDGILKCNYKRITFQKGPFCPELYSKPIILNIVSLVDENISAEIEEIPEIIEEKIEEEGEEDEAKEQQINKNEEEKGKENNNNGEGEGNLNKINSDAEEENPVKINSDAEEENENNDNENENNQNGEEKKEKKIEEKPFEIKDIDQIPRKNIDSYKYMKVKNYIQPKEPIQIEIYIPNCVQKGKIENQIIKRNLKLTAGNSNCEVEIEMKILTVPIELLLSCEMYKLEFINENYYLKTNQLLSQEKIVFKIQNYFKSDNIEMQTRIESLEGNTSKEPVIELQDDTLNIKLPKIENNEAKRINFRIEIYISQNYKIPIIIDSVIMPINYSFQIYDFINHIFVQNKLELLLPTSNYSYGNFVKYLSNNNIMEIELHLLISIPYKNKKIKAKIKTERGLNYHGKQYVFFEYEKKEILIEKERTKFTCKIKIDCGNIISNKIGNIICEFEGITKKIEIEKKDFNCFNFKLEEIDVYKCHYNISNKTFRWDKIKKNEFKDEGIYACPFGHWNYQIVTYDYIYQDSCYNYILKPLPHNNKRFYISEEGIISELEIEKYNQKRTFKSGWYGFRSDNFSLFGTCENEWYPLIVDYEEDLFETYNNYEPLKQKYYSYIRNNNEFKFNEYLSNYFPETCEILKKESNKYRKRGQTEGEYLNKILKYIKENFYLDILKRFKNIKKYNFSFAYFAYLIFEKTKDTLNSLISYLPECIIKKINPEITYILDNLDKIESWDNDKWNEFNRQKYELIVKLYVIFINKKSEIESNNNTINLSQVDLNKVNNKVEELKNELFKYNPNSKQTTKIDSIGKLSQDIEKISQDILKSKEERNKQKALDNNKKTESIIADKFLIIEDKIKSVDKNTLPAKSINLSDINNKSNTIDEIEIEDIIQPNVFSINSLMEYFGSCILKTQMLPAFIRYSFISKKADQITKSTNMISELFNLYNVLENHNFSLISPRIEEYQKSFEIMISKLYNSGVDFSKDKSIKALLKKLKNNNNNQIQDFIILPEKDKFKIRTSNFEVETNEQSSSTNINSVKKNRLMYTKTGIKSIQESQVMNLEYEKLGPGPNPRQVLPKQRPKKQSINPKKKSSVVQNNPQPKAVINKEMQKVFSVLEEPIDTNKQPLPTLNKPDNKNKPKRGLVKKKAEDKKVVITGGNFEGQNFDVEKETNRVIDKMKNINKKKLKLDEVTEREGKLDKLYTSEKLKQFLKEQIKISEKSSINKLLESSEFLSNRIFLTISQLNVLHEIPYKNLEVNILLDCARTIGDEEKFFVMLQVCALTTVLYSLEIPYLISVVGDSGFKAVIKELDEDHSIECLQKALDCIFIKRCNTNIASCIKTATDQFKTLDENSHRVFYMFTNGLDEEFALFDQWKDRIFVHPNHSFAFIFSKPMSIKPDQSTFLSQFWDKFGQKCKSENLPVELIEMSKDKLYIIKKNVYEINENNVMSYAKKMISILRRYKDKDNSDKTQKGLFEVSSLPQLQNSSVEELENNMIIFMN